MTTTPPEYGGCLWPIDPACAGDEWDTLEPEVQDRALALASATLTRLTGGRVGNCPITVRPCKPAKAWAYGLPMFSEGRAFYPTLLESGAWINVGCCNTTACACTAVCSIMLPRPVTRVVEVKVDGEVVPPENYFLSGGNMLAWRGTGPCPFKASQDLSLPDTEPGTYSIKYLNTHPVDSVGACAAGILAMEYAKAAKGQKCRLPNNVTAVTRQGITMELAAGSFPDGLTGIREVDAFIALWNPGGLSASPRVWSPDRGRY